MIGSTIGSIIAQRPGATSTLPRTLLDWPQALP
jgi:hypothetical protein